jgi:hypothetical protein
LRKRATAARSKGGRVEVDGGGALRGKRGRGQRRQCTNGLRKRLGLTRRRALGPVMRRRRAPRPRSRTIDGGDSTTVSRVIEERERVWGQRIAKCGERESTRPKILVRGT